MGNRLPHRLRGSGHCVDMLGGDEGPVNESDGVEQHLKRIVGEKINYNPSTSLRLDRGSGAVVGVIACGC